MDDPASYFLGLLAGDAQFSAILVKFLTKFAAVLLLVGANGFFVGAEFALVSVRRTRLEARAAGGSRRAQAALRLIGNPTLFISATQLGITIASLALGWIGEPTTPPCWNRSLKRSRRPVAPRTWRTCSRSSLRSR